MSVRGSALFDGGDTRLRLEREYPVNPCAPQLHEYIAAHPGATSVEIVRALGWSHAKLETALCSTETHGTLIYEQIESRPQKGDPRKRTRVTRYYAYTEEEK